MKSKKRIGIVGGGQLGRMLTIAAKKMGFFVTVTDPMPQSPAGQVADKEITADYKDEKAIRKLAKESDYLTVELEFTNTDVLKELEKQGINVNPSAHTIETIRDKLKQKQFLRLNKLPTAAFMEVATRKQIEQAAKTFGYPMLLKARFDAYDGKGNALIENEKHIDEAMRKLSGRKLYVEKFVPFTKELAVMVARSTKGEIVSYPVVETIHKNNILHIVKVPAPISLSTQKKARVLAENVVKNLKGAGVFGIEMFLVKNGDVLVNEIAPRVHNSGHYTIETCVTSQFEQHIRAVTNLPLGKTDMIVPAAVMVNILGQRHGKAEVKGLNKVLQIPNVTVHIYGKKETKIERKMGHITALDKTIEKALNKALRARKMLSI